MHVPGIKSNPRQRMHAKTEASTFMLSSHETVLLPNDISSTPSTRPDSSWRYKFRGRRPLRDREKTKNANEPKGKPIKRQRTGEENPTNHGPTN